MPRYFSAPRSSGWVEDEYYSPDAGRISEPLVPDHEATDTGLLDVYGDVIMRAPNPMGFGKDTEW